MVAAIRMAAAQGAHRLNPMVDLLSQGKPVFGLYAPSNRRFGGGPPGAVPGSVVTAFLRMSATFVKMSLMACPNDPEPVALIAAISAASTTATINTYSTVACPLRDVRVSLCITITSFRYVTDGAPYGSRPSMKARTLLWPCAAVTPRSSSVEPIVVDCSVTSVESVGIVETDLPSAPTLS